MSVSSAALENATRIEHWSDQPIADRIAHVGQYVAMTPSLTESCKFIRSQESAYGTAPEGTVSFLLGETRAGKTTAIEQIMAETSDAVGGVIVNHDSNDSSSKALVSVEVMTPSGVERPIFKIFVPVGPTFNGLLADVLFALGIKLPRSATFAQRQLALARQLKEQKTKLIIFDDTQHICERGKTNAAYEAAEVFKVLAKTARAQVLCAGLEHTIEIKDANPQVKWLGGEVHFVRPHRLSARTDTALARFCLTMNAMLPFDQSSHLDRPDVFLPLAILCEGYEGRIAVLVHAAVKYAIENDYPCLDRQLFAMYLRHRQGVADRDNPFEMTAEELERFPEIMAAAQKDRMVVADKRRSRGTTRRRASGRRGQ